MKGVFDYFDGPLRQNQFSSLKMILFGSIPSLMIHLQKSYRCFLWSSVNSWERCSLYGFIFKSILKISLSDVFLIPRTWDDFLKEAFGVSTKWYLTLTTFSTVESSVLSAETQIQFVRIFRWRRSIAVVLASWEL